LRYLEVLTLEVNRKYDYNKSSSSKKNQVLYATSQIKLGFGVSNQMQHRILSSLGFSSALKL